MSAANPDSGEENAIPPDEEDESKPAAAVASNDGANAAGKGGRRLVYVMNENDVLLGRGQHIKVGSGMSTAELEKSANLRQELTSYILRLYDRLTSCNRQ
jgi:hypothetical protein